MRTFAELVGDMPSWLGEDPPPPAGSGRPLMVVVDSKGAGHDVAYVSEEARTFYVRIESTNEELSASPRVDDRSVIVFSQSRRSNAITSFV